MSNDLMAWIAGLGTMRPLDVQQEIGLQRGWLERYQEELNAATHDTHRSLMQALIATQKERLAYLATLQAA